MERLRRRFAPPRTAELPARGGDAAADAAEAAAPSHVQVIWGALVEQMELAGLTVAEAFRLLRPTFNLAPGVSAFVDGELSRGDRRLAAGESLEFVRAAGEKGCGRHAPRAPERPA